MNSPAQERPPMGIGDLPRWLLYLAALVLLGALSVPLVLASRRIGRGEKLLICALGISQTLGALALLAAAAVWAVRLFREATGP